MRTPDDSPQALALGRLGATAVVLLALGAIAPLAVLITAVPAAYARGGGPLVPLGFVVVALVLLLFAAGYAAMAHRAPFAAAMSTYVARGLGRPCGVGAAWVALPSYAALQLGLYGLSAVAAMPLLRGWLSMTPRWWTVAAALWAVVTVCGTLRVEITARLVGVFVIAEVGVTAGLAAVNFLDPAGGRITAGSIVADHPAGLDRPALGLLLAAGVLAFTGFETTGTYAEESVRPRRAPGRATYAVVVCFALLLAAASWSMSVAAGPDQVADLAGARGPELLFDLAAARLAPWAVTLSRIVLLTGLLAALVALHQATSRYLFALGREGILPDALSRTARRTATPRTASLTQSAVVGAVLAAAYASGAGSSFVLAERVAAGGGLGILVLLTATSLAALLHLNRVPHGEGTWARFLAPLLSTVFLGGLCLLAFGNLPALLGVRPGDALTRLVPSVLVALAATGLVHGFALRAADPVLYAGIGQGGKPVVVPPAAPDPREPGAHRPERVADQIGR